MPRKGLSKGIRISLETYEIIAQWARGKKSPKIGPFIHEQVDMLRADYPRAISLDDVRLAHEWIDRRYPAQRAV